MSHTKETWVEVDGIIYPANGREDGQDWIADCRSAGNHKNNARRIVACVNACAGLSTESLEKGTPIIGVNKLMVSMVDELEQQRDELLHAKAESAA